MFDAIVLSNGWGDATAALQLLSHLQDDALSVALLIPMPLRASRKELTDALSSHYGSPGRLANYRREFDRTVRKKGEDPSNFAITLEILAVKAFGNMGQTARLRLIRDRFIAGHENCDLRRYLDCVPPDTPLRDIVDRCRVWESHGATETRRVSKPVPEPVYPAYVVEQMDYDDEPVCVVSVNKQNENRSESGNTLRKCKFKCEDDDVMSNRFFQTASLTLTCQGQGQRSKVKDTVHLVLMHQMKSVQWVEYYL